MTNGNTMRLEDFVELNPRESLQQGRDYAFVAMEDVLPGRRYVSSKAAREYAGGGSRFRVGDTLFARITPCLENGKIAQFCAGLDRMGFGSTEFMVMRSRDEISDPGYVYYLASSEIVRGPAEKSMSGASGRQRADLSVVKDILVPSPPLPTQQKIAAILSAYDDLIENNTRRITLLEEMAHALYREWFVEFRYPGHAAVPLVESPLGLIPQGWDVGRLDDALLLQRGFDLPSAARREGSVPVYAATGVNGYHDVVKVQGPGIVTGRSGSLGTVNFVTTDFWPLNTTLWVKEFRRASPAFGFFLLRGLNFADFNSGAAVPTLNRNDIHGLAVILPPQGLIRRFDDYVLPMLSMQYELNVLNANLRRARDLLLPKLVSGEVDVEGLDIAYEEV